MTNRPTKAMVFAAGLGTRMRPLTNDRPKALVEVAGRTLIDHLLDRLVEANIETAVVNAFHFADSLVAHLKTREGRAPKIILSREDGLGEPLETLGGLLNALPVLGDGLILTCNADAIWVEDGAIDALIKAFDPEKMDAMLLLADMDKSMGFDGAGDFFMDAQGHLIRRGDAPSAPFAYAGIQITKASLFKGRKIEKASLSKIWFEELAPNNRLFGHCLKGEWLHVGDPQARDEAEKRLRRNEELK